MSLDKDHKERTNALKELGRLSRKDLLLLLSGVLLGLLLQLLYDAFREEPFYQNIMPSSYWRSLLAIICGISVILLLNYALKQGRIQVEISEKKTVKKTKENKIQKKVIEKLPILQACLDHEESIRTSYQTVLAEIQVGLFGFVFILIQLGLTDFLWLVVMAGIVLCLVFVVACDFRAKNVDFWRGRIIEIVSGTEFENDFREAKYGWVPLGRFGRLGEKHFGHWFERVLVPAMIFLWIMTIILFRILV